MCDHGFINRHTDRQYTDRQRVIILHDDNGALCGSAGMVIISKEIPDPGRRPSLGCALSVMVLVLLVAPLQATESPQLLSRIEKERRLGYKYSSHQCTGGGQKLETYPMTWAMRQGKQLSKFPMNDAEFRTCKFRNVCLSPDGQLAYYVSNQTFKHTPPEYLPWTGMFHVGHLRGPTIPIKTVVDHVPTAATWHDPATPIFLDAVSWSFNYGHYLIDNVLPSWIASRIFNLPFFSIQQLFETRCRQFTTLDAKFADEKVGYNHSLGSYGQACLARIEGMHHHFFERPPLFIDELIKPGGAVALAGAGSLCFKTLVAGHGSAFGLKSVELGRAVFLREFRDFVLKRMEAAGHVSPPQENLILVGQRTSGAAGGRIINDLCSRVKDALSKLDSYYTSKFSVECFVPAEVSLEQEVATVRRAKVLVSVHGTISYFALFCRDGTQQISIADPKEYKENQILLYLTHTHLRYLTWDKIHQLPAVLSLGLASSDEFFEAE